MLEAAACIQISFFSLFEEIVSIYPENFRMATLARISKLYAVLVNKLFKNMSDRGQTR